MYAISYPRPLQSHYRHHRPRDHLSDRHRSDVVVSILGVEISYVIRISTAFCARAEQQIVDEPRFDSTSRCARWWKFAELRSREDAPSSYRLAEQFGTTDSQMLRVLRRLETRSWLKGSAGIGPASRRVAIRSHHRRGSRAALEGQRQVPDFGPDDRERQAVSELFTASPKRREAR